MSFKFLKSKPTLVEPRANESVSEFLTRVQSLPGNEQVCPPAGEELGEYLLHLRTRTKRSVQEVAATLGNAFPELGISAGRVARLESGEMAALPDDGMRVLSAYYGASPDRVIELASLPSTSTTWTAMSARAQHDLEALGPEEREFIENLLANVIDELRKEDSTS